MVYGLWGAAGGGLQPGPAAARAVARTVPGAAGRGGRVPAAAGALPAAAGLTLLGHGRVRVLAGPAGGGCGRRRRRTSGPADGGDRGAAPRGEAGEQLTLHRTVAGPGRLIP